MQRRIGILVMGGAVCLLAAAARQPQERDVVPCCSISAIDVTRGTVTIKDRSGRVSFLGTVADPKRLSGLRAGSAVGLSNEGKTLLLYRAAGRAPQIIGLSALRLSAVSLPGSTAGAVGSAASGSQPKGTWKRSPKGNCPRIKETSTEQCVRTNETGSYCEYFCVPIK